MILECTTLKNKRIKSIKQWDPTSIEATDNLKYLHNILQPSEITDQSHHFFSKVNEKGVETRNDLFYYFKFMNIWYFEYIYLDNEWMNDFELIYI